MEIYLYILFFLLIDSFSYSQELNNPITIASIGDELLNTATGSIEYIYIPADSSSYSFEVLKEYVDDYNIAYQDRSKEINTDIQRFHIEYYYKRDGNRVKTVLLNNSDVIKGFSQIINSFNGEKNTKISYLYNKGLLQPRAIVTYHPVVELFMSPFCFGYFLYQNKISQIIDTQTIVSDKILFSNFKMNNNEILNGLECDVYEGNDNSGNSLKVWFSVSMLYRPIKILFLNHGEPFDILLDIDVDYKIIENNIPFPDLVAVNLIKIINGIQYNDSKLIFDYDLNATQINRHIEDDIFNIAIPEGMPTIIIEP